MIRDILSLRAGECKFCITDDTPFFFCGDPAADGSVYCAEHHALCHNGWGKDWQALESMMCGIEQTVVRAKSERVDTEPVDAQIRGEL